MAKCKFCDEDLHDVIKETVCEALTQLGIENRSPMDMQRDFQFLRKMRKGAEATGRAAVIALVTTVVGAALGALWLGVKTGLIKVPGP